MYSVETGAFLYPPNWSKNMYIWGKWVLRQYALKMVNIKWAAPPCMRSLSDSTLGQSLTLLAMTVTTICCLLESSSPSVTCLWTSVAFPCCHPHARPNMKSRSSTQRLGPGATHSRDCPCCDASTRQPRISPGSSAPRRRTSMPGVCLHPAPTRVRSEIEGIRASGATSTWWLGPGSTHGGGAPIATHPLNGQASALARWPREGGLADPGFVFTRSHFCALRYRAPRVAHHIHNCHRRWSHYHLHHQAAQVTSYLSVSMFWCAVGTCIFIVLSTWWSTRPWGCLNVPASTGAPGTVMSTYSPTY